MGRQEGSFLQRGSVLVLTLMVLLSLTIIGTLVLSLALLESRMTIYDNRTQQAQQAADAGLEAVRAKLIAEMVAGQTPNQALQNLHPGWNDQQPWEVKLTDNLEARVNEPNISRINNREIIRVTSQGSYLNARKTLQADMLYTSTTAYGLCSKDLSISGHYVEKSALGITKWYPVGQFRLSGSRIACNREVANSIPTNLLHEATDPAGLLVHTMPPTRSHLADFVTSPLLETDALPPIIEGAQLKPCRQIAEHETGLWQTWNQTNFEAPRIKKPFNYIDSNPDKTISLTIDDDEAGWFNQFCSQPTAAGNPWDTWWQGTENDNYPRLIIISPASMQVIFSGCDLSRQGGYILLASAGDINVQFQAPDTQQVRLVAISGRNINMQSTVNHLRIEGSINAANSINIGWGEHLDIEQGPPSIDLAFLPDALQYFPYSWSLFGLGTIVSYATGT